jgi:hypothetical protein
VVTKRRAKRMALSDEAYASKLRLLALLTDLTQSSTEDLRGASWVAHTLELEAAGRRDRWAAQIAIQRKSAIRCELRRREVAASHQPTQPNRIVLPPRLFFDGLLRRFMPLGAYDRYIKPVVADMHHEYFECLARRDSRGARWAVIRGHLYVIPSWVYSRLLRLIARVLGKVI